MDILSKRNTYLVWAQSIICLLTDLLYKKKELYFNISPLNTDSNRNNLIKVRSPFNIAYSSFLFNIPVIKLSYFVMNKNTIDYKK